MGKIGETLREQRENKGFTLLKVEEETKIRKRYLEALESEEYHLIPGRVYVKGFLKTYATFLELDADKLIEEYNNRAEDNKIKPEENVPTRKKKKDKGKSLEFQWNPKFNKFVAIIAAVILLLLVNQFYPWASPDTAKRDSVTPQNEEKIFDDADKELIEEQTDKETGEAQEPQPTQEVEGANLELQVNQGSSWMKIWTDGQVAFEGTISAGETKTFEGKDKVSVRLGNAGAVNITFNGENIGLIGEPGQVVTRDFTREE